MKFIQDAMGWKELDEKGNIVGHMTNSQYELYQDELAKEYALKWSENLDRLNWHDILHSFVGDVLLP